MSASCRIIQRRFNRYLFCTALSRSFEGISLGMSKRDVNNDITAKMFVIHLGNEKAILEYEQEGDNVLNLWHTEVPVSHRRQGLGAQLAKAALDHAVMENFQVKPTCTYIQQYLKDNPLPEYLERVVTEPTK